MLDLLDGTSLDLSELGRVGIAPDQPAGRDLHYDAAFDQLQAEVDRASLPSMAGEVDWEKVVNLSVDILKNRSKDLVVASYLAVGLVHTRGLDGLAPALKIYCDLIEHHMAGLFPQRERARLRAVEWFMERVEAALRSLTGPVLETGQLALMLEHLAKLDELLSQLLPAESPSTNALRSLVERLAQPQEDELPDLTTEPAPPVVDEAAKPAPSAVSECAHTAKPEPSAAPAPGQSALLEAILRQLRESAAVLRDEDVRNPLAYRLARQAAWLDLGALPPAEGGRTKVPAPPAAVVTRVHNLRSDQDARLLLAELEGLLGRFIFWFDLNRFAAEALGKIDGAESAAAAVIEETAALVRRLPGLADQAFADGTPFADVETRRWLDEHVWPRCEGAAVSPVKPGPVVGCCSDTVDQTDQNHQAGQTGQTEGVDGVEGCLFREAVGLLEAGNIAEAAKSFQSILSAARSGRDHLLLHLAVARALLAAGQARYALPLLEQVVMAVENHRLLDYDRETALEGLKQAWRAFNLQQEPHYKQMAREVLNRIAAIDLGEMARLVEG